MAAPRSEIARPTRVGIAGVRAGGYSLRRQEMVLGWTLLTPVLVVMAALVVWPFATAIWIAFTDKAIGYQGAWVGLANFAEVISSPRFLRSLRNSLTFTVASVLVKLVLGMAMALVLHQTFRGRNLVRAFFLIPWVLPAFVGYMIWRWLYDPLQGLLNYALLDLGVTRYPLEFLSNPSTAMPSVIVAHVWRSFPFYGLAFLAGLQNIPAEQYEAAAVDGANAWHRFRYITLPGLRHVILVVVMLSTIWTFNAFEPVYLLTGGGPADATMVYTLLAYEMGIVNMRLGQAAAVPVLILPVLGMFIVALSGLMNRGDE
ncbi:MAG TPA: sugar ABC transporter permease [Chloroflexota bacterium]|nr:sugar ABC transporter permease [Chloroflexota bacterium]